MHAYLCPKSNLLLYFKRSRVVFQVLDNLANSSPESLYRVHQLAGKIGAERNMQLVLMDLLDTRGLHRVISLCGPFDAVIHFAGLKAVGESVQKPLRYYDNNVGGTISLIKAMALAGLTRIIFSSSATVYGIQPSPLSEATPTGLNITNPYGQTKHMIEKILVDVTVSASPNVNPSGVTKTNPWNVVLLRYFNPVGASSSGLIGEQPTGVPNNLMPYVAEVANGKRPYVTVMGTDYETIDGSGERDFIHVIDLADGHLAALSRLLKTERPGTEVFNLGTGKPSSVFQLIKAFERACRCHINVVNGTRRPGDLSTLYSDASKAKKDLNWVAKRTLQEMCADTWRWISKSGNSFAGCVVRRQ